MQLTLFHRLVLALALLFAAFPSLANPDGIAVIVGNRDYGAGIPQVRFALNDAVAMRRFVSEVLGYEEGNVILLENASQAALYATFGSPDSPRGKLWGWAKPGVSDVVVYYSGHGVPGRGDGRGYLLPVDADPDTPEINGYPLDLLYRNLAAIGARSATVYLEACFSGDSAGGSLCRNCSGLAVERRGDGGPDGITLVSAAAADQVASWDEEAQLGLFTHYLLRGLYGEADGDGDGKVVLREVRSWLDAEMSYAARRLYRRVQHARLSGEPAVVLARPKDGAAAFVPPHRFSVESISERMTVSAGGPVNVRAGPGTDTQRVGRLRPGEQVDVNGRVVGRPWLRIALARGETGFVHRDLLQIEQANMTKPTTADRSNKDDVAIEPLEAVMTAGMNAIDVYERPGLANGKIDRIRALDRVIVTGKVKDRDWFRVALQNGGSGYVLGGLLSQPRATKGTDQPPAVLQVGQEVVRDCPYCPELLALPAGRPLGVRLYHTSAEAPLPSDAPSFLYGLAVGRFEVTKAQFARFVAETGHRVPTGCIPQAPREFEPSLDWRNPGFAQTDNDPVVCVSWEDAKSYAAWLSRLTDKHYRLLNPMEWRYAASGGIRYITPWLSEDDAKRNHCFNENLDDANSPDCQDGYETTAPVGRFRANAFGLYDMIGNASELVDNCSMTPGRPREAACHRPKVIGGNWTTPPGFALLGIAASVEPGRRYTTVGFRVMRALDN